MGPVEGLRRNREGVGCLPGRSGFCRALLGRVDKDGQHGHGKEDAYGVRHSGIVNGGTLSGLAVQQAAQALRCQHEVGAGHGAHEGSGNSGDPEVLLFFKEVHGGGPQHDHGQRLVGPAEVAPDHGVVDEAHCVADAKESTNAQNMLEW